MVFANLVYDSLSIHRCVKIYLIFYLIFITFIIIRFISNDELRELMITMSEIQGMSNLII
jgi:hypothetical protein